MVSNRGRLAKGPALFLLSTTLATSLGAQSVPSQDTMALGTIVLTAEEQIKQALGVSTITAEDIAKQPVVNDVAEIIRKMPGVNLTGTSPSGQRGNQRQVDIRGMGPENVLILIDGKPVLSRTAVKQGRAGERDTRGDTNWVAAELVERIEVIRGPAAARYGSGAAGGVVNIITKAPEEDLLQLSMKIDAPESSLEGMTQRYNLLWAKRLNDDVALRFTAGYNRTEADDPEINAETAECTVDATTGTETCTSAAGSEGVVNKDASLLLTWAPTDRDSFDLELGYSRQGNLYAGDVQLGGQLGQGGDALINQLAEDGEETSVMERKTLALTHTGDYAWGGIRSFIQYERTDNRRLAEGTAGGSEGRISSASDFDHARLEAIAGKSEVYVDHMLGQAPSALTLGAEVRWERLDLGDYSSFSSIQSADGAFDSTTGDRVSEQLNIGFYLEDNIAWTDRLTLTPSVRVDWADSFGWNASGGLNASYALSDEWTIKGGVARAFKSPTLYQLSDTYVYNTRGNGCPYPHYRDGPCYVLGNGDISPETSINSEIGIAYAGRNGINATLTYFHNDYRDKIQSGLNQVATATIDGSPARIYQWANIPESKVEGLEGSFSAPIGERLTFAANGTYMIESVQRLDLPGGVNATTGVAYGAQSVEVPLSLVPKYTINAALTWQATDRMTITPSLTHYGKIEATGASAHTGYDSADGDSRDPYTLYNLSMTYAFDNGFDLNAGVTNLFDKQVLRSEDGANTYNEPGRAFYVGLTRTY